jgi:hypothetical protein
MCCTPTKEKTTTTTTKDFLHMHEIQLPDPLVYCTVQSGIDSPMDTVLGGEGSLLL